MPFISVNGAAIHYASEAPQGAGGGPAVLFLHGAGGTHEHWRFQVRHVGPRWRSMSVDLPGHGDSQGEGYWTIPEYRDFVRALLDAVGISRAVLVGHSMGGGIAQSLALASPDRLAGLVLVGTGARLRVHPDILATIRRDLAEAGRLISQWAYSPSALPATVAQAALAFARNRATVLEGDFRACDAFDLMHEIAAIRVPTLVLCGEEDRLTPVKYARFLQQQIPGATLEIIPGAGHLVMLEKPVEFNRALTAFLEAHLGTAV
ncbi:MAG: alpha/beta fold hydrolase [candidate division NC10 bacterium]|nr:alpha/beta fold hydrolase [candidate division NC10 bacterium]